MFNTYKFETGPSHVSVESKEYRAPTDESVRLLREMENEAKDKLIMIQELKNNVFNAKWWVFHDNFSDGLTVACRYKLNDLENSFEFTICDRIYDRDELGKKIMEEVEKEVSRIFLKDLVKSSTTEDIISNLYIK